VTARIPSGTRSGQAGSVAVEMAIILPLVLMFMIGLMEFGRALWTQATLDYAVESAARCGAINTTLCGDASLTQAFAVSRAVGLTLDPSTFTVTTPACGMQVTASLPLQFVASGLLPYAITLTATACYPTPA
jgi:Flp pilus assembly protein TadG